MGQCKHTARDTPTHQYEHDKSEEKANQDHRVDDREPVNLKALGEEDLLQSVPLGILQPTHRETEGNKESDNTMHTQSTARGTTASDTIVV